MIGAGEANDALFIVKGILLGMGVAALGVVVSIGVGFATYLWHLTKTQRLAVERERLEARRVRSRMWMKMMERAHEESGRR